MKARICLLFCALVTASCPALSQDKPHCQVLAPDGTLVEMRIDEPLPGSSLLADPPCPETALVRGVASTIGIPPLLDIFIAVDRSGSTDRSSGVDLDGDGYQETILEAEVAAVEAVLEQVDPANVRIALIEFETDARVRTSLTSDLGEVRAGLAALLAAGADGWTDFVDGQDMIRGEFLAHGDPANRLPVALFLSDGEDTQNSDTAILGAADRLAAAGIRMDTFGVGVGADPDMLERMAERTGGTSTHLLEPADIVLVLPEVVFVGISRVLVVNETIPAARLGIASVDGTFAYDLPVVIGLNEFEITAVADDPDQTEVICHTDLFIACGPLSCTAKTQGYWHRQCMGPHPDFTPDEIEEILIAVTARLSPLRQEACEALDADPPSDKCEKATRQTAALVANIESGLLDPGCDLDLAHIDPDAPDSAGLLVDYLIDLILAGDCYRANDLADAVNTQAAIVEVDPLLSVSHRGTLLGFSIHGPAGTTWTITRSGLPFGRRSPIAHGVPAGGRVLRVEGAASLFYYHLEPE